MAIGGSIGTGDVTIGGAKGVGSVTNGDDGESTGVDEELSTFCEGKGGVEAEG